MNLEPYLPVHGYSQAGVGNTPFVTLGPVVVTPSRARARARVPVNPTVLVETLTGVYVETSWERDGTGSSDYAVTDADYFDDRVGENQTSLSVIASGEDIPAGSYALRAVQYGPVGTPGNVYDMVGKINCWDPTYDGRTNTPRDIAHRIYLKTRDTSSGRDHFYAPHPTAWSNLWALGKTAAEYTFRLCLYTPNTNNPTTARRWDLQYDLDLDTWYRIEILLKYNSTTQFKIWPRIYAVGDTLLYDADDFRDGTGTNYLGTYQATNWLRFNDSAYESILGRNDYGALNCVTVGNDGPLTATSTSLPWLVANCKAVDAAELTSVMAVWVGPKEETYGPVPGPGDTILLDETWENWSTGLVPNGPGLTNGWATQGADVPAGKYSITTNNPRTGSKSLEVNINSTTIQDYGEMQWDFCSNGVPGYDVIYVSMWLYFPVGFESRRSNNCGLHFMAITGGRRNNHDSFTRAGVRPYSDYSGDPYLGSRDFFIVNIEPAGVCSEAPGVTNDITTNPWGLYTYHINQPDNYGDTDWNTDYKVQTGDWHRLVIRVECNTPSADPPLDGDERIWIDGNLVVNHSRRFRKLPYDHNDAYTVELNRFAFWFYARNTQAYTHGPQVCWVDDVLVWTPD